MKVVGSPAFIADCTSQISILVTQGCQYLVDSDSGKLDTQLLLAFVLNKSTSYLHTWPENTLTAEQCDALNTLMLRRYQGEPIAYILGEQGFWSLTLKVSPATLIPRPDTETLIEQVLEQCGDLSSSVNASIRCLDLGTGTGAIALALASELPSWHIEALDYNHDAVALAQENAKNNDLNQVVIYQSDWFSDVDATIKIDVIVSNPPYIDSEDHHLKEGDVRFEPSSALVADEKGLADIIHIATQARLYLTPHGYLFFEHGFEQAKAVQSILKRLGYEHIQTAQDLSGNDRITWAQLQ